MKEEILRLRAEGKSYDEIRATLNCSKGLIAYHCGEGQKEKYKKRDREWKDKNKVKSRISNKCREFGKSSGEALPFKDAVEILENQKYKCYLTGDDLDFDSPDLVHFDHKIPTSKGGKNNKDNLGVCTRSANLTKSDLTVDEYISFCKKVLIFHGYSVTK